MKVLVAEDDPVTLYVLKEFLSDWGYDAALATDGDQAWELIQADPDIGVVVIDWMMPGMDGLELSRRIRSRRCLPYVYIIMLTAKAQHDDLLSGLTAGVDEYLTKPFDHHELKLHIHTGERIIRLERGLATKVEELQTALDKVNCLEGLLPICMRCKKIRDEHNYWHEVDRYLTKHAGADLSHSLCPECLEKHYPQTDEDDGRPVVPAGHSND